jgi:hypothetical protein
MGEYFQSQWTDSRQRVRHIERTEDVEGLKTGEEDYADFEGSGVFCVHDD